GISGRADRMRRESGVVEGLRQLDVDRTADVAGRETEVRALVNVDLADEVRAEGSKVELPAARRNGCLRSAIDQCLDEVPAQTIDGDAGGVAGRKDLGIVEAGRLAVDRH